MKIELDKADSYRSQPLKLVQPYQNPRNYAGLGLWTSTITRLCDPLFMKSLLAAFIIS